MSHEEEHKRTEEQLLANADLSEEDRRRIKRRASNRESARRTRMKRIDRLHELEARCTGLTHDNAKIAQQIHELDKLYFQATLQNRALKQDIHVLRLSSPHLSAVPSAQPTELASASPLPMGVNTDLLTQPQLLAAMQSFLPQHAAAQASAVAPAAAVVQPVVAAAAAAAAPAQPPASGVSGMAAPLASLGPLPSGVLSNGVAGDVIMQGMESLPSVAMYPLQPGAGLPSPGASLAVAVQPGLSVAGKAGLASALEMLPNAAAYGGASCAPLLSEMSVAAAVASAGYPAAALQSRGTVYHGSLNSTPSAVVKSEWLPSISLSAPQTVLQSPGAGRPLGECAAQGANVPTMQEQPVTSAV